MNLLDYFNGFRHVLFVVGYVAQEKLCDSQCKMKKYDRCAERYEFYVCDQVLLLMPVVGSPFQAKYKIR